METAYLLVSTSSCIYLFLEHEQSLCHATQANEMPGHNASLFVLGVMILWFGWYGFNPGSQLVIISNISNASYAVANAAVTTSLAPAAGGMSALLVNAIIHKVAGGASCPLLHMKQKVWERYQP